MARFLRTVTELVADDRQSRVNELLIRQMRRKVARKLLPAAIALSSRRFCNIAVEALFGNCERAIHT